MDDLRPIVGDCNAFLGQILKEIVAEGFDLADFVQMDHMCYRVSSLDGYELKKREFANVARLLGESQVNGRPIAVFRLNAPIYFDRWRIDTVELPVPKPDVLTKEGLEHVEFVIFDDKEVFLEKYAGKAFKMQSADRGINPEIGFQLPTYNVKFHLLSLPTVVYLEKKLGIHEVHD